MFQNGRPLTPKLNTCILILSFGITRSTKELSTNAAYMLEINYLISHIDIYTRDQLIKHCRTKIYSHYINATCITIPDPNNIFNFNNPFHMKLYIFIVFFYQYQKYVKFGHCGPIQHIYPRLK